MRGRKPVPSEFKELAGNPGKRAINDKEPKPKRTKPICPPHLSDEAKKEWKRISKELDELGILTTLDRTALAVYCAAYGRWVEAEREVQRLGAIVRSDSGYPMQNPWLSVANQALKEITKMLSEFGMTPSSRTRIQADREDDDDFSDL